jgi:RNA polymerase sigma factor (sigma-70 family)
MSQMASAARTDDLLQTLERCGAELLGFLRRHTGDLDHALDLLQETVTRALRSWPTGLADRAGRAYLFRVATNCALNWRRGRGRERRALESLGRSQPDRDHHDPERALRTRQDQLWLDRRIAALPARQRLALLLRYFDQQDYGTIGAALGCSPATARAHVYQGLKKLRNLRTTRPVARRPPAQPVQKG